MPTGSGGMGLCLNESEGHPGKKHTQESLPPKREAWGIHKVQVGSYEAAPEEPRKGSAA